MAADSRAMREMAELLTELDQLLKNPDLGADLADRGLNISLALVAASGLRAYLEGRKSEAADDLETAAEEIRTRLGGGHRNTDVC